MAAEVRQTHQHTIEKWSWIMALPLGFCTAAYQIFSVDNAGFTFSDLGIFLFAGYCLFQAFIGQRRMVLRLDLTMTMLLSFYAILLLSFIPCVLDGSRAIVMQYLKSTLHFSYMWFFAVCCAAVPMNFSAILKAIRLYVIFAIPINLFGIYQVPARAFNWPLAWVQTNNVSIGASDQLSLGYEGFFRATSIFSEPSTLAVFTVLCCIFILVPYFLYNVRIVQNRVVLYTSLLSSFVAMFLTFSLTSVAQLGAFVVVLLMISRQSNVRKMLGMFATVIVIFVGANQAVAFYTSTDVFDLYFRRIAANIVGSDKVENTMGDSFSARAIDQKAALSIWKKQPLLGTGFGCMYFVRNGFGDFYPFAHQTYFYALATTGIIGGLLIVGLMLHLCVRSFVLFQRWRGSVRRTDDTTILIAIVPFVALNQTVFGLSSDNLTVSGSWILIGMVMAVLYHPSLRFTGTPFGIVIGSSHHLLRLRWLPAAQQAAWRKASEADHTTEPGSLSDTLHSSNQSPLGEVS